MENNTQSEREVRIQKLNDLLQQGINPFPAKTNRSHTTLAVNKEFDKLSKDETTVDLVGRIRLLRRHGGSTFARIEDESGSIQLFFNKKVLGEESYNLLKLLDVADFISVSGTLFTTKTDEKTVEVKNFFIISKAVRPLPEKWHGLKDHEERIRHRYIDLIMNSEVKDTFRLRSKFIKEIRSFMETEGFIEVETPVLENVPGGAEAEPFITHHNALDIDLYLRISLELHLKRLIIGGFEKVYEIGKVFRNEGISPQHLQEFTLVEFYIAYADNEKLMEFVEMLYQTVIKNTFGKLFIQYKNEQLDFSGKWPRYDYIELFKDCAGINLDKITTVEKLKKEVKEKNLGIKIEPNVGLGRLIDQVYKKVVRPTLVQPCFLINHPTIISPLAKQYADNPNKVERHQVLIAGAEVGNGFSELNDPLDQAKRFQDQMKLREAGDKEAQMIDEEFLVALEHGMPPTAGFGVGIDRLFSILANQESIRDVVFFPTTRPKNE